MTMEGIPLSREAQERLRQMQLAAQAQQPAPEQFTDEQQPVEESKDKWGWVGSDASPEAKEHDDGISDLFQAMDTQEIEEDIRDLTSVDEATDIIDADEDGSLDSLTSVSEEDVMGDNDDDGMPRPAPMPTQSRRVAPRRSVRPRYIPPTSTGEMRG